MIAVLIITGLGIGVWAWGKARAWLAQNDTDAETM